MKKIILSLSCLLLVSCSVNKEANNIDNKQKLTIENNHIVYEDGEKVSIINSFTLEQANYYIVRNTTMDEYIKLHNEYPDMRILTTIEIEDENVKPDEILVDLYGVGYGDYAFICPLNEKPDNLLPEYLIKQKKMKHTPILNYKFDKAGTYYFLFQANNEEYVYRSYANIGSDVELELGKHYVITLYDEDYIIDTYS